MCRTSQAVTSEWQHGHLSPRPPQITLQLAVWFVCTQSPASCPPRLPIADRCNHHLPKGWSTKQPMQLLDECSQVSHLSSFYLCFPREQDLHNHLSASCSSVSVSPPIQSVYWLTSAKCDRIKQASHRHSASLHLPEVQLGCFSCSKLVQHFLKPIGMLSCLPLVLKDSTWRGQTLWW